MSQFFQENGVIPVIQPLAPVLGVIANAQEAEAAHLFKQFLQRGDAVFFPLIHIGVDLFFYKIGHGTTHPVMLFGEIDLVAFWKSDCHPNSIFAIISRIISSAPPPMAIRRASR